MADTKIIVNCETGETLEVELTAEEVAQREADAQAAAEAKAQEEADKAAKAAEKAAEKAKEEAAAAAKAAADKAAADKLAAKVIKGGGGALLVEKIVATSSRYMVVIADESKLVKTLGAFPLPVEVVPVGIKATGWKMERVFKALGMEPKMTLRTRDKKVFQTDAGNCIIDCGIAGM